MLVIVRIGMTIGGDALARPSAPGAPAVVGPESDVEKQLRHLADLGVTDLWPVPFPVGSADVRRTRELLATL